MPTKKQQIYTFLNEFNCWAATQPNILAVALVGSYARNKATSDSDVDLIIIASNPKKVLQDTSWVQNFGRTRCQQVEKYGKVTSLRVWYLAGYEIEFSFTDEAWAKLPLDEGTEKIISDGMQILFERGPILGWLNAPRTVSENLKRPKA